MKNKKQFAVGNANLFDGEFTPVNSTTSEGNEIIPFHDFKTESNVKGRYIGDYHFNGGSGEDSWDAFKLERADKSQFLVNQSHQIKKALEGGLGYVFSITWKGLKDLKGGRSVNVYEIQKSVKSDMTGIRLDDGKPLPGENQKAEAKSKK